jgi:DNA-binding transcriptional LysR family regulator
VQPAVSQAVGRLEDELGIALFERSSRRVTLTSAGEAFLPHARGVLERLAHAERAGHELSAGRSGIVRLASTGGARDVLPRLLSEHRAAHPDVRVELQHARRAPKLQAILDGEIDAALVHTAPATAGLSFTEVAREPWRAVVSAEHPLAASGPVELRALRGDSLVQITGETPAGDRLRDELVAVCRAAGFEPVLGPALDTLDDALIEIARSTAWTLLRAPNAREARRVGVVELEISDDLPPARLWLAHRSSPPPATRSLVALAHRLHGCGDGNHHVT